MRPRGDDDSGTYLILGIVNSDDDSFRLLSWVDIRGGGLRDGLQLFDNENLGVFSVSVGASALEHAVAHDSENPEHPEEDADAASKDECEGPALPRSESHEGDVETAEEGASGEFMAVVTFVVVVVVVGTMVGGGVDLRVEGYESWGSHG